MKVLDLIKYCKKRSKCHGCEYHDVNKYGIPGCVLFNKSPYEWPKDLFTEKKAEPPKEKLEPISRIGLCEDHDPGYNVMRLETTLNQVIVRLNKISSQLQ